jgi:predicted porin
LTVRGGYAYQPDPREARIQLPNDETTDRATTFFAAGFSYRFDAQLRFDFSWMQEQFDDQYRPYASVRVPGENVDIVAPVVDEEITRNQFLIGLTYSF